MITKQIEIYAEKKIDFINDVHLIDRQDGKGVIIGKWNLAGIAKPDLKKLKKYSDIDYLEKVGQYLSIEERIEKLENQIGV